MTLVLSPQVKSMLATSNKMETGGGLPSATDSSPQQHNFSQPPPRTGIPNSQITKFPTSGGNIDSQGFTPHTTHHSNHQFHHHPSGGGGQNNNRFQPFFVSYGSSSMNQIRPQRDRKGVMRRTVDYNITIMNMLEKRVCQRQFGSANSMDLEALQPDSLYTANMMPTQYLRHSVSNVVTSRFIKAATNKMRCPVFTVAWTPDGRRMLTGSSSGEFTLWNGLTFNFETILQAHDASVRSMVWGHSGDWMITGDHMGYIKYWQSTMNNVKMFQAHKEPVRRISFGPGDTKFATCSDDGTVRIHDFISCTEERVLRGHGSDVKCVDWHPTRGLIASGSKDNQQPVKLWDPRSGTNLTTLHAHKATVLDLGWNKLNGNWLITCSRDHLIKLFDIRYIREQSQGRTNSGEMQVFRGHRKEVCNLSWHPIHETVFSSGGFDGSLMFWNVIPTPGGSICDPSGEVASGKGASRELGSIENAHESIIWSMSWHPLGHILVTGSNDHSARFWTRSRPGDTIKEKYHSSVAASSSLQDQHGMSAKHSNFNVLNSISMTSSLLTNNNLDNQLRHGGGILASQQSFISSAGLTSSAPSPASMSGVLSTSKNSLSSASANTFSDNTSMSGDTSKSKEGLGDGSSSGAAALGGDTMRGVMLPGLGDVTVPTSSASGGSVGSSNVTYGFSASSGLDGISMDFGMGGSESSDRHQSKKIPFSKPISRKFQSSWNQPADRPYGDSGGVGGMGMSSGGAKNNNNNRFEDDNLPPGCITLHQLQSRATAVVALGNVLPIVALPPHKAQGGGGGGGYSLFDAICHGERAVKDVIRQEYRIG